MPGAVAVDGGGLRPELLVTSILARHSRRRPRAPSPASLDFRRRDRNLWTLGLRAWGWHSPLCQFGRSTSPPNRSFTRRLRLLRSP